MLPVIWINDWSWKTRWFCLSKLFMACNTRKIYTTGERRKNNENPPMRTFERKTGWKDVCIKPRRKLKIIFSFRTYSSRVGLLTVLVVALEVSRVLKCSCLSCSLGHSIVISSGEIETTKLGRASILSVADWTRVKPILALVHQGRG